MTIQWQRWAYKLLIIGMLFTITVAANAQQANKEHVVKQGETLYRISLNYGVSIDEIYRLNPSAKDGLKAGQKLTIPSQNDQVNDIKTSEPTYYKVESGETLYSISRRYSVPVDAILKANPSIESADKLSQGIIIIIPSYSISGTIFRDQSTKPSSSSKKAGITGLIAYKVPAGATIYSLLQTTGWSEEQLYHYNPDIKKGLKAGATILIPDSSLSNNEAMGSKPAFPVGSGYTVALALPFSDDKMQRFSMYYEGFLMSLLEAKKRGINIQLHVVDCSAPKLSQAISSLSALPQIDLILGGVSEVSIEKLAQIANMKGSTYVIPFTSKDYSRLSSGRAKLYQVNTPHQSLYREVAQKFVSEYKNHFIQIVRTKRDKNSKDEFITTLIDQLNKSNIAYGECDLVQFGDINTLQSISNKKSQAIVVPDAGSLTVAKSVMESINVAKDSLYISNLTPFGYPEWQTYTHSIGNDLKKSNAIFYTTFFAEPESRAYNAFEKDFKKWYNHSVGTTFPRYSILGYDTGRYFLELIAHQSNITAPNRVWRGVQSKFEFHNQRGNSSLKSNLGVFFVQYQSSGEARRF